MGITPTRALLFLTFCIHHTFFSSAFGINYGQVANNLPSPNQVATLITSLKITKARIYDTNPEVLTAFANSAVELIVTVPNDALALLADPQQAFQWVSTHVRPYFPATRITGIAVGNEVYTMDDRSLTVNLVPAMVSIHSALVQLGLQQYIHVSTANSLALLETSYPPSAGVFKAELVPVVAQFLHFLAATGAPFWINAYPYFAYKDDPNEVPLDYVLFNPNTGMDDPYTKLHYDNMLYAQVDAVVFAMARMGYQGLEVRVSETGWPSKGDENEVGATIENARAYNRNLLARQLAGEGTPLRPSQRLEVYVFALFNEDMKPGPTSERNYGLYLPDGTMAYNVGLVPSSSSITTVSLTSNATREDERQYGSKWYWILICLLSLRGLFAREGIRDCRRHAPSTVVSPAGDHGVMIKDAAQDQEALAEGKARHVFKMRWKRNMNLLLGVERHLIRSLLLCID